MSCQGKVIHTHKHTRLLSVSTHQMYSKLQLAHGYSRKHFSKCYIVGLNPGLHGQETSYLTTQPGEEQSKEINKNWKFTWYNGNKENEWLHTGLQDNGRLGAGSEDEGVWWEDQIYLVSVPTSEIWNWTIRPVYSQSLLTDSWRR